MLENIEFAYPGYFYLFLLLPLLGLWYYFMHRRKHADMQVSSLSAWRVKSAGWKVYARHLPFALRILAIAALIVVMARPQSSSSRQDVNVEGIDIVTALDISSSMLAEDFKPNRLEAAKNVATSFINGRPNDRVGLVVFSGETFTQCPLTTDHGVVKNLFRDIQSGMIEDGTAIGDGLATAVNRLKNSVAISKVVILLTDGENNSGAIDPVSAAEIAKKFGVRVYTIGVGQIGTAPYPFDTHFGKQYQNVEVRIDEDLLKEVAEITGGKYFRATNNNKLEQIYGEIDKLEKSKIDVTEFQKKHEEFLPWMLLAIGLFLLEFLLRNTLLKTLP
jgi:Ca-activated chloride channel family protein